MTAQHGCGRRRVRLCLPRRPSTLVALVGWVLDSWLRQSQRRRFESQRRLLWHSVSEVPASTANWLYCTIPPWNFWVDAHSRSRRAKIVGQGGQRSGAKAGHNWGPRQTKHDRGVRVKAGQDRGSRRATIGCQGGQRWRTKAGRDHSEIKRGNSVVGAGSDSVCLAAGVLLWRGGLSAGRLTQTIAATWVRIPATAPTTWAKFCCDMVTFELWWKNC